MAMSEATKNNFLGLENFCMLCIVLCLFMLILVMCYMTYFSTAFHFMAMSVATKVNFVGLENFCMLMFIVSTLPINADCFDVLHDLLQHCLTLHGHDLGHQDQLLGAGGTFACYL